MAQLALGIAGSVIGNAILPGIGGSIGWAIGAALGGLLDPVKQEGPRLADLRLQKSSYGGMLPIIYAKHRTQGNVIWQTDLVEHKQKSGGKGGPEITNYTYTASFAIALCEGPVVAVLRVWANGRLMYDETSGSSNTSGDFQFAFYPGDEDQLPDPTMQAELGVDQVPAYRGTCYVVFTDFAVGDYGNAIPNLEFEVLAADLGGFPQRVSTFDDAVAHSNPAPAMTGQPGVPTTDMDGDDLPPNTIITAFPDLFFDTYTEQYRDKDTGATVRPDITIPLSINSYYVSIENTLWAAVNFNSSTSGWTYRGVPSGSAADLLLGDWAFAPKFVGIKVGNYFVTFYGGTVRVCRFPLDESGAPAMGPDAISAEISASAGINSTLDYGSDGEHFFISDYDGAYIYKMNVEMELVESYARTGLSGNHRRFYQYRDFFAFARSGVGVPGIELWRVTGTGAGATWTQHPTAIAPFDFTGSPVIPLIEGRGLVFGRDGVASLDGLPEDVTLAEVVADLSVSTPVRHRAGLAEADIDVEELTDIVDGYLINQQGAVRTMIEALMPGYFFDAAEIDDVVAFRKRGRYSIATITDAELAAREYGNEAPAPLTLVRSQEADLPRVLNIDYVQRDADYQPGTQYAERQSARSESKRLINVPVSFSDDKAKAVAASNLSEAWLEREKGSIFLPRKFAYLTPTDVIVVKDRTWRIKQVIETKPGIFQFDIVPSIAAIYIQPQTSAPSTGIDSGAGGPPLPKPATTLLLLDIPLVRGTDVEYGLYAAMAPAADGPWAGASLQKSNDAGATYAEIAVALTPASMGTTTTALGDFTGYGNTVDHINRLTVVVDDDVELSGVTRLALLSGANDAIVGADGRWERIAYEYAELVDVNTYVLSNLRRGRSGTEWAMGTHEIGDSFVLLSTVINPPATFAEIGLPLKYKPVTFGRTLDTTVAQDFTNEAEALRPLSPVHLGGGRLAGDLLLDWDRRTRIGGAWKDNTDVPLSEPSELYTVRIWTDGTYTTEVRAFDSATQDTIYLASEQTTDFGSPQATLHVSVEQVGQYRNSPQTRAAL